MGWSPIVQLFITETLNISYRPSYNRTLLISLPADRTIYKNSARSSADPTILTRGRFCHFFFSHSFPYDYEALSWTRASGDYSNTRWRLTVVRVKIEVEARSELVQPLDHLSPPEIHRFLYYMYNIIIYICIYIYYLCICIYTFSCTPDTGYILRIIMTKLCS